MSSATIAGDFQSSGTGDALCNQLAATAGLDGTYRVLHSTSTTPWIDIAPTARGWIRPDGMPVADQLSDLSGPTPAAISMTETGALVSVADRFWAPHTAGCQDWSTTQGTLTGRGIPAMRGSNYQSGGGDYACDVPAHVICLGVDRNVVVDPVRETGRRAFTSQPWSASSGLPAADATCASEATAAGLPGTFRALLAMPGASAISRFDLTRGRWSRVDGVPLLPTAAAWATATDFDAAPSMHATGADTYYRPILTGAPDFGTPGTSADTCNGWSDAAGQARWPWYGWDRSRTAIPTSCASTNTLLLCLQE